MLHEIAEALQDLVVINFVSLKPVKPKSFEIRMNCDFNRDSWSCVKPILQKHSLQMKVGDRIVTIYSSSAAASSEAVSNIAVL